MSPGVCRGGTPATVALLASAAVMAAVPSLGLPSALREALVFGYGLAAPGWSLGRLLRIGDVALEVTVAVALSMTTVVMLAFVVLEAHRFDPVGTYRLALCITALGAALALMFPGSSDELDGEQVPGPAAGGADRARAPTATPPARTPSPDGPGAGVDR
ncbi:MAG TPA: hypothetical protein VFP61_12510 [Acidimicrobiales bacterium]|nr:hypothetical protein [Acidimicrobiales bacterium]